MLFKNNRKIFRDICDANRIHLDFDSNRQTQFLLKSIFVDREYADYFPFFEDALVVDIGAHRGYFSLFASVNLGEKSRIIAIEPDRSNFFQLNKNITDSGKGIVETMNCAIGGENGEMKLYHGSTINSSLISDYALNKPDASFEIVPVMTLENLFHEKKISAVDFLKMDCEGAEYDILLSANESVLNKIKTISLEFHDLKSSEKNGNALVRKLSQVGFHIVKFTYDPTNLGLNYGKIIATKLLAQS